PLFDASVYGDACAVGRGDADQRRRGSGGLSARRERLMAIKSEERSTMFTHESKLVMDVLPWPQGQGFSGTANWWEYVGKEDEQKRLDNLMGLALLDEDVRDRLLDGTDDSLLTAFGLSEETRTRLRTVRASSLVDLAQAITRVPYQQILHPEEA